MLERLDTIDWANVRQMFGDGRGFPQAIRDLTSPDPDVREGAFERIDNHAVVQGSLTEAAAVITPFLLEILSAPETHGKSEALDVLYQFAVGTPRLSAGSETDRRWAAAQGLDFAEEVRLAGEEHQRTREALAEGIPVYCKLLGDADPEVRLGAAYLLACLPEARSAAAEPLLGAAEQETNPAYRGVILQSCGELYEGSGAAPEALIRLLEHPLAELDRAAAAKALALVMKERTPEAAVDVLIRAAQVSWPKQPPGPTAALNVSLPLHELTGLGPIRGSEALIQCLKKPRGPRDAHRMVEALLTLLFAPPAYEIASEQPGAAPPVIEYRCLAAPALPVPGLTDLQRKALAAVSRCDAAWQIESNLLEMFGLPASRAAFTEWLAAAPSSEPAS